jgi:hypothetical protein
MTTSRWLDLIAFTGSKKKKSHFSNSFKYYKFNLLLLLATAIPMLSVALFNYTIDPYDVFNTPNYFGLNHSKPKKDNNDRLFKALDITRLKPTTVIIGSSRTKQGIDPNHLVFADDLLSSYVDNHYTYNLAINGPNVYEVRRYLEHAIANQSNLKEVVFGVDFFMFNDTLKNQPSFSEDRLGKKNISSNDLINALFSLDTIGASHETIEASRKENKTDDSYGENGFTPNHNANDGKNIWRFNQYIKLYFELHSDYQFSKKYFDDFKQIVALCKEKGIKLKVFISPSHATDMESIRATGKWQLSEEWKRKLAEVTPIWDFSGYNSVTTQKIEKVMTNYSDSSHYTHAIGDWMLERIFARDNDKIPLDFGVLLTPKNVNEYLDLTNKNRDTWAAKNQEEVKLVENLYRQVHSPTKDVKK